MGDRPERQPRDNRRLSLYPLDVETALQAAVRVEPPPKPTRKGRPKTEKPAVKDDQQK